jgi:hypothetical protein
MPHHDGEIANIEWCPNAQAGFQYVPATNSWIEIYENPFPIYFNKVDRVKNTIELVA